MLKLPHNYQPRQHIKKPTKANVHLVKAMVFPVVMYGCESWTRKKAEHQRIDAFQLWFWRTLESPLDCKEIQPVHPKGNQSWVFTGGTDAEAETPILWPPDAKSWLMKRPWCWERLKVWEEGDDRGWDGWMASLTRRMWVWVNSGSWWWTGRPGVLWFMGSQRVRHDWATELNWHRLLTKTIFFPSGSSPCLHYGGHRANKYSLSCGWIYEFNWRRKGLQQCSGLRTVVLTFWGTTVCTLLKSLHQSYPKILVKCIRIVNWASLVSQW